MSASTDFRLPSTIASTADLQAVVLEVRAYEQWLIQTNVRRSLTIKKKTQLEEPQLSSAAKDTIRSWQTENGESVKSIQLLAKTLEQEKMRARSITITLAAPASASLKAQLIDWCRANLDERVFVTFEFQSSLLGGMVVRCGSKIHDWSFRSQLLAARKNFPEVLRRV